MDLKGFTYYILNKTYLYFMEEVLIQINSFDNDMSVLYLCKFGQNSLLSFIFPVAEETVSIDVVFIAIEWNPYDIFTVGIIRSGKGNLGGGSTQVQWANCIGPMRMYPGIPEIFL